MSGAYEGLAGLQVLQLDRVQGHIHRCGPARQRRQRRGLAEVLLSAAAVRQHHHHWEPPPRPLRDAIHREPLTAPGFNECATRPPNAEGGRTVSRFRVGASRGANRRYIDVAKWNVTWR